MTGKKQIHLAAHFPGKRAGSVAPDKVEVGWHDAKVPHLQLAGARGQIV